MGGGYVVVVVVVWDGEGGKRTVEMTEREREREREKQDLQLEHFLLAILQGVGFNLTGKLVYGFKGSTSVLTVFNSLGFITSGGSGSGGRGVERETAREGEHVLALYDQEFVLPVFPSSFYG
eukprot:TRINITY_DN1419_c0_g1_i11.p2 TRINITY_DN1419_c0_g1~~TRINITY_DN1419_c0_g1_i11.p2  ORF type:complete len:122 (+),score=20.23 TRINITY_DN1419_c0_g1_i11:595-960(+)